MDIRSANNQINETSSLPTSGAAKQSSPNSIYSVSPSQSAQNSDNTSFGTPEATNSALENALKAALGDAYPKIKEDMQRILDKLGIHAPRQTEITEDKIKKIKEAVEKIVDSLKAKNLEINAENLFNEACNAVNLKILEKNGLSKEEYEAAVKNGEAKSLREILGLQENEEITEEKVKAHAQKVMAEIQAKISNSSNPTETLKQEIAAQKKRFAICLLSTPVEERCKLIGVVEEAFSENRADFINDIFATLTPESRKELANQIGWEKIQAILSTPDINGNSCTIDEKTGIITTVTKHQNAETIRANEEKFMAEAREFFGREDVKAIQAKIKNGEELTADELQIAKEIETYTAYSAGSQIGVTNSVVLTEESRKELLTLLQNDAYELPNYREVLEQIHSFVENEENAEYLTISKEEITKLMDKASNGNYSKVISDIQNGTTTELNAPKNPNATSASDLGYTNRESVDTTVLNTLMSQVAEQSKEDTQFVIEKEETKKEFNPNKIYTFRDYNAYGKAGRKAYIEKFGYKKFFSEALSTSSSNSAEKEAENIYKGFGANEQANLARTTLSYNIGKHFIDWMSKSARSSLNMLASYNLTNALKDAKDEDTAIA